MQGRIIKIFFWLRCRSLFRIMQRTLVMLMPVAVIGAFFKMIRDAFFAPDSLIYNICNFDGVMPNWLWNAGADISFGMVRVSFGIFGLYAAYLTGRYTARLYHKDSTMAGMISTLVTLLCAYFSSLNRGSSSMLDSGLLNADGVLLAIGIGYIVGQIFHLCGREYHHYDNEHISQIRVRTLNSFWPTLVTMVFGLALGLLIYFFKIKMLNSTSFTALVTGLQSANTMAEIIPLSLLCNWLSWLGINYPSESLISINNSGAINANLDYALRHGNSWIVPNKILGSSLIQSYGNIISVVFIILLVILLFSKQGYLNKTARINLLPAAFNSCFGFFAGAPLILNPVFLLPLLFLPLVNMLLAVWAMSLHLIPYPAYPVLSGTPGVLIPFFSSNGSWNCLVFFLLLIVIDGFLTLPFVRINDRVEEMMRRHNEEADLHA